MKRHSTPFCIFLVSAALFIGATTLTPANGPAAVERPLVVGSKSFAENVILGEMVLRLVEATNGTAIHKVGLGGTQILWQALLKGDLDVYPDYTGTLFQEQFFGKGLTTQADLVRELGKLGLGMTNPIGFVNTYAVGMRRIRAKELGITKISQLGKAPGLAFGFSQEFMTRNEGWPALRKMYDLPQTDVRSMDHELSYRALANDSIAVKDLFSTDAELELYDLVALEDDLKLFPDYQAVFIYRLDAEQKHSGIAQDLERLAGQIGNQEMIRLNALTKIKKIPERDVARAFVEERILKIASKTSLGASAGSSSAGLWSRWLVERPFIKGVATWASERAMRDTSSHLFLVVIPLLLNILVGIPLGVWAALRPKVGQVLLSVSGVIQTIPSLAMLVLMIPLLGIGYPPAFCALFLYGLLPILRNTYTGLTTISPQILESANALGLPRWQRLIKVELPLASRHIFSGIKISAVINVGTATLGAIIGAGGFGEPIMIGIRRDDMSLVLQGAIPAAVLAIVIQFLFDAAERFVVPRGLQIESNS